MTLAVVLVVVAAAAWYVQGGQRRPGAGSSASARARQLRTPLVRIATALGISTRQGRQAARWEAGAEGERRTAARLQVLVREGWMIRHDLGLPKGNANVDHLAISPTGVVVIPDSKLWSARYRVRVVDGRLLHGSWDVTDRLAGLRHEARAVAQVLGVGVIPIVSMDGAPVDGGELLVDGIRIVPADRLVQVLRELGTTPVAGPHPGGRAARLLKPHGRK